MTTTRTLADIDRDLDATVVAWQDADKAAHRNRTAARHALDAGSKDGYLHATNAAAAAEAEAADLEALRDRLAAERRVLLADPAIRAAEAARLEAKVAADLAEHGDPFAGLS